ncbi:hypothetical protein BH11PLA2_BH11PLA2_41090 [soil metagenome]
MIITLSPEVSSKAARLAKDAGFADAAAYVEFLIEEQDEDFEPLDESELAAILARGREDHLAGRMKTADDAFADLFQKHNLPRSSK